MVRNYAEFGFDGRVFAVNRSGSDVFGLPGVRACSEIGELMDVAFLMLPQSAVLAALDDVAAAGIRYAVVLSAGYAEIGADGIALQNELVDRARELGITLWGPNSLGFNNVGTRTPISAIAAVQPILPPSIAIITQSGASAIEINEYAHSQNIGSSFVAATGNEAMIGIADLLDFLVDDPATRAIAIFAETIRDPVAFIHAAERARAAQKPVVILKIGRSTLAGSVAQAHTGSLIGDDRAFDAMCARLGVIRVHSAEDLVTTGGLLAATGALSGPGMVFVSTSGGACTLVADGAEAAGVDLPEFTPDQIIRLRSVLPIFASTLNPLDITGALMSEPDLFEKVLPEAVASPDVGLLAVNMIVPTLAWQGFPAALSPLGRALAAIDKPSVIVTTTNKALNDVSRQVIAEHGLPHVVTGIDAMLRATARLGWWSKAVAERPELPAIAGPVRLSAEPIRGERELLDWLADHGVPVVPGTVCTSLEAVERCCAEMTGQVVLKVASADIAHKTEVGGVRLNVPSEEAGEAFDQLLAAVRSARPDAAIAGVIVSPMRCKGVELLVGVKRDPAWGPMIAVGLGGVMVDLLDDVIIAPLPITREHAIGMLESLRGARLLRGFRGSAAVDLDMVAAVVVAIGEAALVLGDDLEVLEINPLLIADGRVEALDALATWRVYGSL